MPTRAKGSVAACPTVCTSSSAAAPTSSAGSSAPVATVSKAEAAAPATVAVCVSETVIPVTPRRAANAAMRPRNHTRGARPGAGRQHLDVVPRELPEAQQLGHRFLGGEPGRVVRRGVGLRLAVRTLGRREQPLDEPGTSGERLAESRHVDQVEARRRSRSVLPREATTGTIARRALGGIGLPDSAHSTVTVLARLRGWSTVSPLALAT